MPFVTIGLPCWTQAPLERERTHTLPEDGLATFPPKIKVLPSLESATERPWLPPAAIPPGFRRDPPLPFQLENVHPGAGFAVREITVPGVYPPLQFWGVLTVTVPVPLAPDAVDSE
jgi:hypothetical protein